MKRSFIFLLGLLCIIMVEAKTITLNIWEFLTDYLRFVYFQFIKMSWVQYG